MSRGEWQPTRTVQMSIQTAEQHILGHAGPPELYLTTALISIARGTFILQIRPVTQPQVGALCTLNIAHDRPVMRADAALPTDLFEQLITALCRPLPRPATVILLLNEPLIVSVNGYLDIAEDTERLITDLSWVLPLQ